MILIQVAMQILIVCVVLLSKPQMLFDGSFFPLISLNCFHSPILVGLECLKIVYVSMDTSCVMAFFSQRVFTSTLLISSIKTVVCCMASLCQLLSKVIDLLGVGKRHYLSVFSSTLHYLN
jgi:hypothetical protein